MPHSFKKSSTEPAFKASLDDWRAICKAAAPLHYPASAGLFRQGAAAREVFLIDSGMVKLTHTNHEGREQIVGIRSASCMLGVAAAIVRRPYPVTAVTLTPCLVHSIDYDSFIRLINTDAQFSWQVHQLSNHEAYDETCRLIESRCLSARQRLEQLLVQFIPSAQGESPQSEISLKLPMKYWEIAEMIAVTPEHLSRILRQMKQEGVIRRRPGGLVICAMASLYRSSEF